MPLYFVYVLCCFLCTLQLDLFSYESIDELYVDLLQMYASTMHDNGYVAIIDDAEDTSWENLFEDIEVVHPVTVGTITVKTVTDQTVTVKTVLVDETLHVFRDHVMNTHSQR
jgi:hypothetical protein